MVHYGRRFGRAFLRAGTRLSEGVTKAQKEIHEDRIRRAEMRIKELQFREKELRLQERELKLKDKLAKTRARVMA